jgi:hypothetical protein
LQKVIFFICVFILTSCTTPRGALFNNALRPGNSISLKRVIENNLSQHNFSIPRLEVEVKSKDESQKFLVNLKHAENGSFLVSLRNNTGIEALRVLIATDSIKANDRLNRTFYTGSIDYLADKYGMEGNILNLILGDLFNSKKNVEITNDCENGQFFYTDIYNGKKISYLISCRTGKVMTTEYFDFKGRIIFYGKFEEFAEENDFTYPKRGILKFPDGNIDLTFNINRIEKLDNDSLTIIQGKNYEKIMLK